MSESSRGQVVRDVQEKAKQLESLLDDFSDRLRRMRQRNREVEHEIASFEEELDRLHKEILAVGDEDAG